MLTLEEIKIKLQDRRPSVVMEKTGLSYPTIQGIRDGTSSNPTLNVLQKLSDYFEGKMNDKIS